jgi:hypothetical protein
MATPCGRIFEHAAADRSVSTVRPQQGNRLVVISGVLEPFATLALCCACLGLGIPEASGLQWHDVDWLRSWAAFRSLTAA